MMIGFFLTDSALMVPDMITTGTRGIGRGEHRGYLPSVFPEFCNIYHFLPYKYQHLVVTVVFRDKNNYSDYKAISK